MSSSSEATRPITLSVNGEPHQCAPNLYLPDLLQQLGMNPRLVAVEYNGEILHRQFWEATIMQEGDRLEIVTIVGGG
ncbi:thiamine biosynthesis protein ThiS [Oculatella sp. LEGE 06141]|uniref:sulfur carrier protein ThiS n=1 Tax=Oculatella sp. LEGE 06141 TaxID=1828648 RepID=UPI001882F140|nr:sulfur carrier protein ThiS [Oculatella sp. LEGE 06141]MBE9180741.1 thiamine biosynthesis protein ThiS [Oculatella sp. LEGE 06141]